MLSLAVSNGPCMWWTHTTSN